MSNNANLMMIVLTVCFFNFFTNCLTLGIIIFRDWETKKSKSKDKREQKKQQIIKGFKVVGIILISFTLLLILDIAISAFSK